MVIRNMRGTTSAAAATIRAVGAVSAKIRAITRAASGAVCAPRAGPTTAWNGQASAGKRGTLNVAVGGRGRAADDGRPSPRYRLAGGDRP